MKLISVIVPYHRKKNYFSKTLKSILNQSYKKFEVLIIYDDNDISELTFVKSITKKYKNVRIIVNKKQIGAGESRNKGIKFARGDYLAFLDADDLWKRNKLKHQLNFMKKNNITISHTSYDVLYENKLLAVRKARNFYDLEKLIRSCDIGLSTVMIKKSEILKKKLKFPKIKTKEDFVLWLNLMKKGYKIYGIQKSLSQWRKLDVSLSSSTIQKLKDGYIVYYRYMKFGFLKSIIYLLILSTNFMKKNIS